MEDRAQRPGGWGGGRRIGAVTATPQAAFVVGIDLGTTNTVVACASVDDGEPTVLPVLQRVAGGGRADRFHLASALYAPLPEEASADTQREGEPWICGEYARRRAAEVPGRGVTSAKSWLSYPHVDRRAAILPWRLAGDPSEESGPGEAAPSSPRISPVAAAATVLRHVVRAWDAAHPDHPLADQRVVLTVPASFDAVARELTVDAAASVGLDTVRLLEEPQAAFYDQWRRGGDEGLAEGTHDGRGLVLVVDCGGGTTDLSLLEVGDEAPRSVARVAVGRHLLLGGDNMDLALAHLCEGRWRAKTKIDDRLDERTFASLVAAARHAKERLLGAESPDEVPVTIARRSGARLVGSTLRTTLARDDVASVVGDGFFPGVPLAREAVAAAPRRGGMVAFGLPYERDVAVTRHVAAFVRRHRERGPVTAVLLNGGVFRSPVLARRMVAVLDRWFESAPVRLRHNDPDTSVALGAVAYGLARAGRGRRIASGAPRSYFLGVGEKVDRSSAGPAGASRAVCVLPMGVGEGVVQRVEGDYALTVGQKVRFDLYAADAAAEVGDVVVVDEGHHERLAPLVTELRETRRRGPSSRSVPVALEAELSAIGTLDLSAVTIAPPTPDARDVDEGGATPAPAGRRYALAFDLGSASAGDASTGGGRAHEEVSAARRYGQRLVEAQTLIERVFSKRTRKDVSPREVKGLVRRLEKQFGPRGAWEASLVRALFDFLITLGRGRRTSAEHERVFWMLAGYCLRPGVGHARDADRVARLASLSASRLAHPSSRRSWEQFWICWRRIAAGLDQERQAALRDVLDPFLAPSEAGLKVPKPFRNEAHAEMLELAAGLERVPAARRGQLGGWVIERTWTERDPRLWAALGRIGARVPTYASAHHVVAARTIERWMDHLLREDWAVVPSAPGAAIAMCRLTGDRARDLAPGTRDAVDARLDELGVDVERRRPIHEVVPLDEADRAAFFGDELPHGLVAVPTP